MLDVVRNHRVAVIVMLLIVAFGARAVMLPVETIDQKIYLLPWLNAAASAGPRYLRHSFTNYAPFYEHILALITLAPGPPMVRVKLVSILFDVILAACVTLLVPRNRKVRAFLATLLLPTIMLNSAMFAQSDAIYAVAILLAIAAAVTERPIATMLCFSLALAIKFQALLFLPVLALLVLERRQPLWTFVLVPCGYIVFAVPMLIAGRPLDDTFLVYVRQAAFFSELSLNAPNPWLIASRILPYRVGVALGLPAAIAVVCGSVLLLWRSGIARHKEGLLLACAILLMTAPYVTPKMHDRYFFLVDPVLVALACLDRRYWKPLLLVESASLFAYVAFPLGNTDWGLHHWLLGREGLLREHLRFGWDIFPLIGAVLMGWALLLLARQAYQMRAAGRAKPSRHIGLSPLAQGAGDELVQA